MESRLLLSRDEKKEDIYEHTEFFNNGKIKEKFNKKENYPTKGPYVRYYENGKLAEKGAYDN